MTEVAYYMPWIHQAIHSHSTCVYAHTATVSMTWQISQVVVGGDTHNYISVHTCSYYVDNLQVHCAGHHDSARCVDSVTLELHYSSGPGSVHAREPSEYLEMDTGPMFIFQSQ